MCLPNESDEVLRLSLSWPATGAGAMKEKATIRRRQFDPGALFHNLLSLATLSIVNLKYIVTKIHKTSTCLRCFPREMLDF